MESSRPLTIFFLPLPSPGHLLPMLDIATLFASRGTNAVVVLTPAVAAAVSNCPSLQILTLPLPSPSVTGLPPGIESADTLPSRELYPLLFYSLSLLAEPFTELISDSKPDALFYDACLPWAANAAAKLNLLHFAFPGTGCFPQSIDVSLFLHKPNVIHNDQEFTVLGLLHNIILTKNKLRQTLLPGADTDDFFNQAREAERNAAGFIVNSFDDIEPGYIKHLAKITGKPVWAVGPVALSNPNPEHRGVAGAMKTSKITSWLDKKPPRSVLYVCFGSLCRLPWAQIKEVGYGLEKSGVNFIWVVGKIAEKDQILNNENTEEWMQNLKQRVARRGVIVSPGQRVAQLAILNHESVNGFLSHCGWGSAMESATSGVPLLTWPVFGEQFYNEKLVIEVLGIGVGIGVERGFVWGEEEKSGVVVERDLIAEKVSWFVHGGGDELVKVREKAAEMKVKARIAAAEGGSSFNSVTDLVKEIERRRCSRPASV